MCGIQLIILVGHIWQRMLDDNIFDGLKLTMEQSWINAHNNRVSYWFSAPLPSVAVSIIGQCISHGQCVRNGLSASVQPAICSYASLCSKHWLRHHMCVHVCDMFLLHPFTFQVPSGSSGTQVYSRNRVDKEIRMLTHVGVWKGPFCPYSFVTDSLVAHLYGSVIKTMHVSWMAIYTHTMVNI